MKTSNGTEIRVHPANVRSARPLPIAMRQKQRDAEARNARELRVDLAFWIAVALGVGLIVGIVGALP